MGRGGRAPSRVRGKRARRSCALPRFFARARKSNTKKPRCKGLSWLFCRVRKPERTPRGTTRAAGRANPADTGSQGLVEPQSTVGRARWVCFTFAGGPLLKRARRHCTLVSPFHPWRFFVDLGILSFGLFYPKTEKRNLNLKSQNLFFFFDFFPSRSSHATFDALLLFQEAAARGGLTLTPRTLPPLSSPASNPFEVTANAPCRLRARDPLRLHTRTQRVLR